MSRLERYIPYLILTLALGLRLWGLFWGFPDVYEGDSPHLVNTAVYFGSGDLNPHVFKYPTLWMYLLFAAYTTFFGLGRLVGAFHSAANFGALFVWKPWVFYLIARLLTLTLSLGGIAFVMRAGQEAFSRWASATAGLVLALSPYLVGGALYAKGDMLYFFFVSVAWWAALRVVLNGRPWDYRMTGLALGFAASSHYGAIVLAPLLWLAHGLRAREAGLSLHRALLSRPLWAGTLLIPLAFLAGSPYIALDFPTFWKDFSEGVAYAAGTVTGTSERGWRMTFATLLDLGGWPVALTLLGGAAWSIGLGSLGWFLLGPVLAYIVTMGSLSMTAGSLRFMYGLVPGLALLSGVCVDRIRRTRGGIVGAGIVLAIVAVPNLVSSIHRVREFALSEDTRRAARDWIVSHIPAGAVLLLDQVHASPNLVMAPSQVETLYRQTLEAGNRRAEYYRLMLKFHPGGGYWIYRMKRTAGELGSFPRQTALSQAGYAMLEVEPGLSVLRQQGVQYVVTSTEGATPETVPRLRRFFDDLERAASLIKVFEPQPGRRRGPTLKLYKLR